MSYIEAQQDGIEIRHAANGTTFYCPLCHLCGKPTFSRNYIRRYKYTCKECKRDAQILKHINKTA